MFRELGRSKEAKEAYEAAVAGFERALRDRPDDLDLKSGLADALHWTSSSGSNDRKIAIQRRIVALWEDVFASRPTDGPCKRDLALSCSRLYESLIGTRPAEALLVLERSVVLRLELAEAFPDDADAIDGVFVSFFKLARAMGSSQSLALNRRALEFGRESLRLRPNDPITAHDFLLATQDAVAILSDSGRNDDTEVIAELRRSVKTLGELARVNADTPSIQESYLGITRDLADRLVALNRPDEAVRTLLESQAALDRFPRGTAADLAGCADRNVALAQRLGEINPDLTPEQKARRNELLDHAVGDYRAAVAGGWKEFAVLKDTTLIEGRPGHRALMTEAESAAKKTADPDASGRAVVAPAVSRPRLDVKRDRAIAQAALGVVRARSRLVDEAIATMDKAGALFDELRVKGPATPKSGRPARRTCRLPRGPVRPCTRSAQAWEGRGVGRGPEKGRRICRRSFPRAAERPGGRGCPCRALLGAADVRREASRWGETYLALRKSEAERAERLLGVSGRQTGRPEYRRDLGPCWLQVR